MSKVLIISAVFLPEPLVSAKISSDIAIMMSNYEDVMVVCPHPSRPDGYNFEKNKIEQKTYSVHYLNSYRCPKSKLFGRIKESYSFGKHCVNFIKRNRKDIKKIYINSWPFISQYLIVKQAVRSNIKTILHIQDIYPESLVKKMPKIIGSLLFKLLLPIDKYTLRNASKIIGISTNMNNYLSSSRKVKENKFSLVRNWQEDNLFNDYKSANLNNDKNVFVFMYIGSISASAGVDVIIKSFDLAKMNNSRLIIAGDGSEKEKCIKIAMETGNVQIEFKDVTPSQTPFLQSEATVLLLPLKKGIALTATPSKLTAYLFSGRPVLATVEQKTDVYNIIRKGKCGVVKIPENIASIAEGMKELYLLPKPELNRLGENGRKYAEANLSKKINLKKCISIINNT